MFEDLLSGLLLKVFAFFSAVFAVCTIVQSAFALRLHADCKAWDSGDSEGADHKKHYSIIMLIVACVWTLISLGVLVFYE